MDYATGITNTVTTGPQGETQLGFGFVSANDSIQYVAYNDKSTVDNVSWAGGAPASIFGYSYNDPAHSTGWINHKIPVPAGYDLLWGDPALAVDPYNANYVYISNMASSSGSKKLDSFCVARFSDRTHPANYNLECHKVATGASIDGQNLASGGAGQTAFLSYWRTDTGQIDIWATCGGGTCGPDKPFVQFAGAGLVPFPNMNVNNHPRMAIDPLNGLFVIMTEISTTDGHTYLALNWANPGQFLQPSAMVIERLDVNPGDPGTKKGLAYAIATGLNDSGQQVVRIAFVRWEADNHYHIRYKDCTLGQSQYDSRCTATGMPWDTINFTNASGNHDELFPGIAFSNGHWKSAFYTSLAGPTYVAYQSLQGDGSAQHPYVGDIEHIINGTNTGCPILPQDNGDYNDLKPNWSGTTFIYTFNQLNPGDTGCNSSGDSRMHIHEANIPF